MFAALTLGFLGSLHCVGMCGPIAASLPGHQWSGTRFMLSRLLYNSGRTITYALLGMIAGSVGYGAGLFSLQRWFSLGLGIVMLLFALRELGWLPFWKRRAALMMPLRNRVASWFARGTMSGMLGIGMANGLLPCGFVYTGLFLAAMAGTPQSGALNMLLFGAGTLPAMLMVSFSLRTIAGAASRWVTRLMPYSLLLAGSLLVVRGMALGIPWVSPQWVKDSGGGRASCCVKAPDAPVNPR